VEYPVPKIIHGDARRRSQLIELGEQYHAIVQQKIVCVISRFAVLHGARLICFLSSSSSKIAAMLWQLGVQAV